jgi:hypothetical protein
VNALPGEDAAGLAVVSYVLLSRVISTDAHDLARTRAEAVAANVTVRDGPRRPRHLYADRG